MLHRMIMLCIAIGVVAMCAENAYSGMITGSTVDVSGLGGTTEAVTVTLHQFSATNPSDVDVVLVGPTGAALVLLGGAGGSNPDGPLDITFDDTASTQVTFLSTGSFKPTQNGSIGAFPSPGPGLAYQSPASAGTAILGNVNAAGVFGGTAASTANPNGTWSLYVMDAVSGDSVDIADGWSLNLKQNGSPSFSIFTNSTPLVLPSANTSPEPGTLTLVLCGIASMAGFRLRRRVTR